MSRGRLKTQKTRPAPAGNASSGLSTFGGGSTRRIACLISHF